MPPADANALREILGEVDPLVLEQIVLTEATTDEVVAAYAAFEAERSGEPHRPLTKREEAVFTIIEDAFDDLDERDWNYPN